MNWEALVNFATLKDSYGEKHPYWTNPSKEDFVDIMNKMKKENPDYPHMRGLLDFDTNKLHVWSANKGIHHADFTHNMGISDHVTHRLHITQKGIGRKETQPKKDNAYHIYQWAGADEDGYKNQDLGKETYDHPAIKKLNLDKNNDF